MTRNQSSGTQKGTRTRIADIPEIAVELSEREMRIVSGGLTAIWRGCSVVPLLQAGVSIRPRTQYNTNGDWDTD